MNNDDYAFVSYQTSDKRIAGRIKNILSYCEIPSFLAHEDIEVSREWRDKILEEIGRATLFICLLSKNYKASAWCMQESGIAAFRKDLTIIPFSIDGSIPEGFIRRFQATQISESSLSEKDLLPGLIRHNKKKGIDIIISILGRSGTYRSAESNFKMLLPYLDDLTKEQLEVLLDHILMNKQIHHASLCAKDFIPPILEKHGDLLAPENLNILLDVCKEYE